MLKLAPFKKPVRLKYLYQNSFSENKWKKGHDYLKISISDRTLRLTHKIRGTKWKLSH